MAERLARSKFEELRALLSPMPLAVAGWLERSGQRKTGKILRQNESEGEGMGGTRYDSSAESMLIPYFVERYGLSGFLDIF